MVIAITINRIAIILIVTAITINRIAIQLYQ